ncbi:hypothetical protein OG239_02910 [Streptomyces sp. NBC_00868]|uniref:hypothetical protein n=1 Tax=unclassified Streptomyces TaxID=2593676 RepID=UPI003253A164|nr:hypothetical protein OG239_02910 [Streptomyces sp. NBC_00868]
MAAVLAPQRLIERVVVLDEAAALLPGFDRASPEAESTADAAGAAGVASGFVRVVG